jgi:hypothetical protein
VRLRRYISRNRAWGLSFEQQRFDRRSSVPVVIAEGSDYADDDYADLDHIQFQALMLDYYLYFRRMHRRTPYLIFSAGAYRPQFLYDFADEVTGGEGQEVKYPQEGFLARVGAGLEYFISRGFSVDASVSGYLLPRGDISGRTFTAQGAIGFQLYPR